MSNDTIYAIFSLVNGAILAFGMYWGFYEHNRWWAIYSCWMIALMYADKIFAQKDSVFMGFLIGLRGTK